MMNMPSNTLINAHVSTEQIAQNFAKAHATYGKSAIIQQQMCQRLLDMMSALPDFFRPKSVLEIGCGVGTLTKIYTERWQFDKIYLNDLYDVKPNVQAELMIGDIERLDLPTVDMVLSSSALQWMKDLPRLFDKVHQALTHQGVFAFASFGQSNLKEIKTLTGVGLEYYDLNELIMMLKASGFHIVTTHQSMEVLYFSDAKEVLRHIKETGVSVGGKAWTKSSLRSFYDDYHAIFATDKGYPLSYDTLFVVAIKS